MTRTLTRSSEGIIAGVCAGLADHLNLSPTVVRVAMAGLALAGGAGILFYAWLWVLVPVEEPAAAARSSARSASAASAGPPSTVAGEPGAAAPGGAAAAPPDRQLFGSRRPRSAMTLGGREILLGIGLLLLAAILMAQQFGASIRWDTVVPIAVVLLGAVLVWMQLDQTRRAGLVNRAGADQVGGIFRLGAGLVLVIIGVLVLVSGAGRWELMWSSVLASLAVLAGVALVLAPWALKFWRDLEAERSGRIRETERAEIAAHLHDSVLQTLALIQNRAGSEQDVTKLARAQERELRSWLYRDSSRDPSNFVARMQAAAAEVEDNYGHAIDVVAVGDAAMSVRYEALLQASREAILNAARHAGPASVYVEAADTRSEVFVRDRGKGFVFADIPADRMGVRESIVSRMQRHGGTATITSTENGTEVSLSMPSEREGLQ